MSYNTIRQLGRVKKIDSNTLEEAFDLWEATTRRVNVLESVDNAGAGSLSHATGLRDHYVTQMAILCDHPSTTSRPITMTQQQMIDELARERRASHVSSTSAGPSAPTQVHERPDEEDELLRLREERENPYNRSERVIGRPSTDRVRCERDGSLRPQGAHIGSSSRLDNSADERLTRYMRLERLVNMMKEYRVDQERRGSDEGGGSAGAAENQGTAA